MTNFWAVPCMDCKGHHRGVCATTLFRDSMAALYLAIAILLIAVAIAGSIR